MTQNRTNLDVTQLIVKIQQELDDLDLKGLSPDTAFRELEGWDSLHSLVLMAMVATEYDVELESEQLQKIRTVRDLHQEIVTAL